MNNNDFYRQLSSQKTDVEQNIIVRETKLDEIQIKEISITEIPGFGIFAGLILFDTFVLLKLLKKRRQGLAKIAEPVKYFSQVPCRKCRFFSSNSYLQCAVHPSIVLKDEAKDCSDYWSK